MQEIKIHQPIIDAVIVCLKAIFEENKVADKEVGFMLKQNKNFGSRDRSMIAENVYDIVRWKLKYNHQLSVYSPEFTLYKHLILVSLLNRKYIINNPEIFGVTNNEITALLKVIEQPVAEKNIEQSYPKEFYEFCLGEIGDKWYSLAEALNKPPKVFIRTNITKISNEELLNKISALNIDANLYEYNTGGLTIECIEVLSKNNLKNSDLYKEGLFEFQDIGSQAIGLFLWNAVENKSRIKELRILDLCAGAGGKTLHLSALLNNQGTIYATDYKASRLKNLYQRAEQAGCTNIKIIDFKDVKNLKEVDIILLDAPCSGTGTFKRQADLKYKITEEKIKEYQSIQASLLNEYKKLIHKNGKIIYATCSILPQENELQIKHFIAENPSYRLENEIHLLPSEYDGDGFYMAEISRK